MLKYALLGAAMAMTAPALAQTAPATSPAPATVDQSAQTTTTPAPATDATAIAAPAETAAATTAAPQPAPAEQVANAVDQQFTAYDKDADGKLNEAEFGTWMVALKTQSDPKTDANAPATKSWNKAAFAQADKDKSKSVSKAEIAGFLTPAKS